MLENLRKSLLREIVKKLKQEILQLKKTPCKDCGLTFPPCVMDFDHVRGKKIANIGVLAHKGNRRLMHAELKKCEVVCSNCHRIRTWKRGTIKNKLKNFQESETNSCTTKYPHVSQETHTQNRVSPV